MARTATLFVCQTCGSSHNKWAGKCEACGEWNTIVEEIMAERPPQVHVAVLGQPRLRGDVRSDGCGVADDTMSGPTAEASRNQQVANPVPIARIRVG